MFAWPRCLGREEGLDEVGGTTKLPMEMTAFSSGDLYCFSISFYSHLAPPPQVPPFALADRRGSPPARISTPYATLSERYTRAANGAHRSNAQSITKQHKNRPIQIYRNSHAGPANILAPISTAPPAAFGDRTPPATGAASRLLNRAKPADMGLYALCCRGEDSAVDGRWWSWNRASAPSPLLWLVDVDVVLSWPSRRHLPGSGLRGVRRGREMERAGVR